MIVVMGWGWSVGNNSGHWKGDSSQYRRQRMALDYRSYELIGIDMTLCAPYAISSNPCPPTIILSTGSYSLQTGRRHCLNFHTHHIFFPLLSTLYSPLSTHHIISYHYLTSPLITSHHPSSPSLSYHHPSLSYHHISSPLITLSSRTLGGLCAVLRCLCIGALR